MSLPIRGVRHVMAHTISTEPRAALSEDAVEAVQVCTGEFLSLLVSEARQRVAREGRDAVTEADLLAVLNTLGFRGFTDSLKSHLQRCAAEDAQARSAPARAPGWPAPGSRQTGQPHPAGASPPVRPSHHLRCTARPIHDPRPKKVH